MRKTLFAFILAALVAGPTFAGDWTDAGMVVSIQGEITVDGVHLIGIVFDGGPGVGQYNIDCPLPDVLPNACLDLEPGHGYRLGGRIVARPDGQAALILESAMPTEVASP